MEKARQQGKRVQQTEKQRRSSKIVLMVYDDLTMPVELRKAHQDNDRAVMQAYGFDVKTMTESQCVAELFKLYQELTK